MHMTGSEREDEESGLHNIFNATTKVVRLPNEQKSTANI